MKPTKLLQPRSFDAFRCIGADCEDTCCDGWGVVIDKGTFTKYQDCGDPALRSSLGEFITINTTDTNDEQYAKITLSGTRCPFLSEGLCSIQQRLGEEYLSKTCATYPRVINIVDDVLQRSLDLSCPEAARLVLLDPGPLEFHAQPGELDTSRLANLSVLDTSSATYSDKPYRYFWEVRSLVVKLLQNRTYPLWKRLVTLGYLCDKLTDAEAAEIPGVIQDYQPDFSAAHNPQPALQLEIVLELIVARITSDFTNRRFLQCYEEFMHGIQWTAESSMEQIGQRYAEAWAQYYAPFMSQHEYILENYLVNYVYKTLFPYGPQESNHKLNVHQVERSIRTQYMLMAVYYAIIRTVLIGMAGFHKSALGAGDVVKLIQSCTRTFEHSLSYPGQAIQILSEKGMTDAASMAVLALN